MSVLSAFDLAGRRILVTGANTGIGQGIALSVAKAGGEVVGVGRSSMADTAARITAIPPLSSPAPGPSATFPRRVQRWKGECGSNTVSRCAIRSIRLPRPLPLWVATR